MKATPFNVSEDLEPIPFSQELCRLALEMKEAGLPWKPHVGCFVWDRQNRIPAPSPFPLDIYFILNLNHFTRILGSLEEVGRAMVWLPTYTQCRHLLDKLSINGEKVLKSFTDANGDLVALYKEILAAAVQRRGGYSH
jgi:hypothetical protein